MPTWGTGKEGVDPSEWDTTLPAGPGPTRSSAPALSPQSPATFESGASITKPLVLLERLGDGAYGAVFRARDNGGAGREVAVKIMQLRDSESWEAERDALRACNHPNILRVLDAFEHPQVSADAMRKPYRSLSFHLAPNLTPCPVCVCIKLPDARGMARARDVRVWIDGWLHPHEAG